ARSESEVQAKPDCSWADAASKAQTAMARGLFGVLYLGVPRLRVPLPSFCPASTSCHSLIQQLLPWLQRRADQHCVLQPRVPSSDVATRRPSEMHSSPDRNLRRGDNDRVR